jgi:urease accessory protein
MRPEASQLLLLLNWMSPSFPTGNFAYSHGLEWEIAERRIVSAEDVLHWIADVLSQGSGWNDAVLFAACWENDAGQVNELALALCSSSERYRESTQLGSSFVAAARVYIAAEWPEGEIAYPVAAALACRAAGVDRESAITAYAHGFASALVSVAVRLVPLGQNAGLHVLKQLMPVIAKTAVRASRATLAGLGSCTLSADIAAMHHETLEPRVFRT